MIQCKIFNCSMYASYELEEKSFNEFLKDIQNLKNFCKIDQICIREHSIVVTYYLSNEC